MFLLISSHVGKMHQITLRGVAQSLEGEAGAVNFTLQNAGPSGVMPLALNDRLTNSQDLCATLSQPNPMLFHRLEKCHAAKKRDK